MTTEEATTPVTRPAVVIQFKKSSTKGGDEGYELSVTSDATREQVELAVEHAALARRLCREELDAETLRQLEASLAAKEKTDAST